MRKGLQYFVVQGVRENGDITELVRTHSLETRWATKDCGDFPWATAVSRMIDKTEIIKAAKLLGLPLSTVEKDYVLG